MAKQCTLFEKVKLQKVYVTRVTCNALLPDTDSDILIDL